MNVAAKKKISAVPTAEIVRRVDLPSVSRPRAVPPPAPATSRARHCERRRRRRRGRDGLRETSRPRRRRVRGGSVAIATRQVEPRAQHARRSVPVHEAVPQDGPPGFLARLLQQRARARALRRDRRERREAHARGARPRQGARRPMRRREIRADAVRGDVDGALRRARVPGRAQPDRARGDGVHTQMYRRRRARVPGVRPPARLSPPRRRERKRSLWSDAQRDEFIARVFRRVLFSSHWSPYDPVRAVHADP